MPVFLPGESRGRGSLVGCRLWGRTGSDTTEATQQQQQNISCGIPSLWAQSLHHVRHFCDSMDCIPPASSVHGIFQARLLEQSAIFHSRGSSRPRKSNLSLLPWQVDSSPLKPLGSSNAFLMRKKIKRHPPFTQCKCCLSFLRKVLWCALRRKTKQGYKEE